MKQQQHNKGIRRRMSCCLQLHTKFLVAVVLLTTCTGLFVQYTFRYEAPRSAGWAEEEEKKEKRSCGASRVRGLPAEEFCRHGFVLGRSTEAGLGNEMYKILNAAALTILLNRSLIIVEIKDKYPFGDYISYSNQAFNLTEVKHLWRHNDCLKKYGRHLVLRSDNFLKPAETNVMFESTTDALASQFFLKNIHPEMRDAASHLFGHPEELQSRPNVFGELMHFLVSPSEQVQEAIDMVLAGGADPDVSLHMRMMNNRPAEAVKATVNCVKKAIQNLQPKQKRPRVVFVSDNPSFMKILVPDISRFAEVLQFNYTKFGRNIPRDEKPSHTVNSKANDWGPAPRWVAFVDFFLAARAKHAVISGAKSRVGTTYAQLIAALAAANQLGNDANRTHPQFRFMSSFQSNLLKKGLSVQSGWGHVWSRFAGPLSCENQSDQCAFTPLAAPAWWDGPWQSPVQADIKKLSMYGVRLSGDGTVDGDGLELYCGSRNVTVVTTRLI
ncbi:hypothetical protein LINGRAHAP2_LOCUS9424 [Linum grandiflorum]